MQRKIIRLLALLFCGLSIAVSAAAQSIHVEWGYTPPSEPAVTGFKLYQEGAPVCQTQNPNATAMDCEVTLTAATTNFTLTATFSDGSESPHSAPFAFTSDGSTGTDTSGDTGTTDDSATTKTPVSSSIGNKLFTFSWEQPTDLSNVAGYRFYLNSTRLCETTSPTDTSIACTANLLPGEMIFSMSQVHTDGSESGLSNLLVFNPTAYPETFTFKLLGFSWEYSGDASSISGFRIYQNNLPICETTDPAARNLTCTVDVPSGNLVYGVKAVNADGTESSLSNLLAYTPATTSTDDTATLQAVIQATPVTGTAPVTVNFNAGSSTGTISQYQWDFGDGSIAATSTASHEYASAGTYTAKLTVTNTTGASSTAIVSVTVTEPAVAAIPPTAVLSSSSAAGPAPLSVNFDGTGSTATGLATITSYAWSFGDGSTATGATATHSFTAAGTYTTELTVTDSNGLTSSASTPVVVTAAAANIAPKAALSATPTSGSTPLTVSFDGSASTDSDGSIASYTWHFGDGSSASGKTVSHTYTTEASFIATLQVTDDLGATATTSTTITVKPQETAANLNIETGEVAVTGEWVRVSLSSTFQNPVVIAGPASFNDPAPGVIRLRNVDATGFDIKFTEWNYLDGAHPQETASYLVIEKGHHTLPDGSMVEAGSFTGKTSFATIPFNQAFSKKPVMMTTIASNNETDTISGRIKDVTTSGFAYYFREQEKNTNKHINETINYLAWEPGEGSLGSLQYRVAATANVVTQAWYAVAFPSPYSAAPLLLADMQTTVNTDTSALRMQKLSATGFEVKVEEEQSKDTEVAHPAEAIGYIALSQKEEKVLATFTWEFDATQESTISGFQILANGTVVCTCNKPADRQLSCEMTMPTGPTAFTIQAVDTTGGVGNASNSLNYTP
ncbi:PKD domain containing protein [Desulfobulbus propionicus DSM 2032]|uniref:PKD domain containing protein n=1 Tax=Desulfobulbus propionicus (strain ATCC 33891 / DSM 2032 / VKM B-1956 / 1pr3) TaxID=577650 RepID=A0A7U4DN11_DESPD|nr:PKD domain-containing protein [Desulfobulbus propionicus]ADW16541.1 PKD domain containing protein [Desulfobulbus propionicus DSM 2032]